MKKATLFVVLMAVISVPVLAATFVVPSDEILVGKADVIIEGEVLTTFSRYSDSGRIVTVAVISVADQLKGSTSSEIEVVHPGGRLGGVGTIIEGVPDFRAGDRVVLFLMRHRGHWTTVDLALGKFRLAQDRRGRTLALREFTEIGGWDLSGKAYVERHREAAGFRKFVRSVAAGVRPRADYFLDIPDEEVKSLSGPMTVMAGESPNDYTMEFGPGQGVRWNNFDSTTQLFYNRNSQSGIGDGGVDYLQQALAAWTNDCDSLIKYEYGDVNASARGAGNDPEVDFDGINGVVFEDVFNDIAGSFNCTTGGVLGIGGPWAAGTHTIGGDTMWTTLEGNVTIQDGVDCWSGLNDGRFIQLLVHEIGHTLGFRHSDQPVAGQSPNTTAAIMRASLTQNFGSTLQQYDKDAATTVYPGGTCATVGDLNLDGRADLLWRRLIDGKNAVWYMNGSSVGGNFSLAQIGDSTWEIVGSGDFDGDGDSDILWRNNQTGSNAVWHMNGTTRESISNLPKVADDAWVIVSVADFDGDTQPDLLWYNTVTGKLVFWYMDGVTRSSIVNFDKVADTNWRPMGASDFDDDGDPDLVWRHLVNGTNKVWSIEGGVRMAILDIDKVGDMSYELVAVGDFDGDGDGDIVWRHTSGRNYLWIMDGLTRMSIEQTLKVGDTSWQVVAPN